MCVSSATLIFDWFESLTILTLILLICKVQPHVKTWRALPVLKAVEFHNKEGIKFGLLFFVPEDKVCYLLSLHFSWMQWTFFLLSCINYSFTDGILLSSVSRSPENTLPSWVRREASWEPHWAVACYRFSSTWNVRLHVASLGLCYFRRRSFLLSCVPKDEIFSRGIRIAKLLTY